MDHYSHFKNREAFHCVCTFDGSSNYNVNEKISYIHHNNMDFLNNVCYDGTNQTY
ncbi:hypothetical protein B7P43_G14921 [Cryptotermes secundus]|uniref:Uncharacterized protein n=1 Tax=Cryptotermes secundus TaxID=105785 RepID=A0A2J7QK88_9NEOP|nr:hypothetical protein B7P43_G14921 [Cryptotermes secundus]